MAIRTIIIGCKAIIVKGLIEMASTRVEFEQEQKLGRTQAVSSEQRYNECSDATPIQQILHLGFGFLLCTCDFSFSNINIGETFRYNM